MSDLTSKFAARLAAASPEVVGRVEAVGAGVIHARIPNAEVGGCHEVRCEDRRVFARLVGFGPDGCTLLPFGDLDGIRPGAAVHLTDVGSRSPKAVDVLGDVIDPLGRSLVDDTQHSCTGSPLRRSPPSPLRRRAIDAQLWTGVRAIDGLLPLGEGQRVGLFAGSGVGKSTLLGQLARGASADVVVVGLIGERGREVAEFVEDVLGVVGRSRTTVVVATSDASPMMRARAAETATALAEQWRDAGKHCLLLMDSLTRYARALRESALLAGERPARMGYPASVFAELPRLLERAGCGAEGAITAIYTVLVAGGDMEEPVSDEVRGIVDGHWVLSRRLAERQHFPAIDVPASVSRVASRVVSAEHLADSQVVRRALSLLSQHGDAIDLGIYEPGTNASLDRCLELEGELRAYVCQASDSCVVRDEVQEGLAYLRMHLDE